MDCWLCGGGGEDVRSESSNLWNKVHKKKGPRITRAVNSKRKRPVNYRYQLTADKKVPKDGETGAAAYDMRYIM